MHSTCTVQGYAAAAAALVTGCLQRPHLVVHGGALRGEAGAHDVGAGENELYCALVHAKLPHHVRVLVYEVQLGAPRPVACGEEDGLAIAQQHLNVAVAARATPSAAGQREAAGPLQRARSNGSLAVAARRGSLIISGHVPLGDV